MFLRVFVLFFGSIYLAVGQENVALGKIVRESSFSSPYTGFLVVDGLLSPPYCFTSQTSGYQWVQIDLIWLFHVNLIDVYGKQLTKVVNIRLTNENLVTLVSCNNLTSQLNSPNVTFQCPNTGKYSSRYISIDQSSNAVDTLSICEVVVDGQFADVSIRKANLVLKKMSLSSSEYPATNSLTLKAFKMISTFMVDGVRDTTPLHGHCVQTSEVGTSPNWIQADMDGNHHIDYIAFTNRDTPLDFVLVRSTNFIIGLTPYNASDVAPVRGQYPLCNTYPGAVPRNRRVTLQCNANLPAYRYVIVQQAYGISDGHLTVCELEVYEPSSFSKVWISRQDHQLVGYTFLEFPALRPMSCIVQCIKLGLYQCDSINFNKQLNVCQLNSHRNGFQIGNFASNKNWTFWNATYYYPGGNR
ncbi:hypothetical protein HELRODRAFT_179260 [Helobdella robusta]|uniref:Apple domain-containing protein n=1 Tax=Helobdella robusta TaxID=6412 RepID=T1FEG2_HELRO|nr:hypothetical protein HELRODRAFT_179260 [Helobdella robusta]ESN95490.1 hypothetical protein HELRODRAFT_179260 [Helobdella robusta]